MDTLTDLHSRDAALVETGKEMIEDGKRVFSEFLDRPLI
jgi:hypothetical protein